MATQAFTSWTYRGNGPKTVEDLRVKLIDLASGKGSDQLIAQKFVDDHVYPGHADNLEKLAANLARLRSIQYSTLITTSVKDVARAEVLNWIKNVSFKAFRYRDQNTWELTGILNTVPTVNFFNACTVDSEEFNRLNPGQRLDKVRAWLTRTHHKQMKAVCRFDMDGTPVLYHFDY